MRQGRLSLILATAVAGCFLADGLTSPLRAAAEGADAVVLVNSQSARHLDFKHLIQPYLDSFGFPYAVQDIATNPPNASLRDYAVIIIGHSQLDTNLAYLSEPAQTEISLAVSNGLGLVNFDNDLFAGEIPRYRFVSEIFGFGYAPGRAGTSVSLPPTEPSSQMHYITSRHSTNDLVWLRSSLSLPGLVAPATATVLAEVEEQPLVVVVGCGKGRAVQWGSYDWMLSPILGPVAGLDDLVWRGVVWAARKPFVMRGLPHFVTMRIDDVSGPFGWLQAATAVGFKPFVALFFSIIAETNIADLRLLISSGQATAGIHSFDYGNNFFYFDHVKGQALPDLVQSNNFYIGTQWLTNHGIALSRICATHYSEIGVNAFAGLKAWGVEFVPIEVVPGTVEYATPGAPWLRSGPYRLYENPQLGQIKWPTYYADWLTVPGHPEFDGQFFNVYCEVRDVDSCGDWCPNNDVAGSISRGARTAKRALDSMVMSTIFTHEFDILPVAATNWQAILQGITNSLAYYDPIYVTLDYASRYVRATRTSRLLSSAFDPNTGQVTATFSGRTDLDTGLYVFTGADNAISSTFGNVPAFSTPPTNPVVVSGAFEFVSPPASRTNDAGGATTFTVRVAGAWPLSFCWYRDGTNALSDGGRISGARSTTLTISNLAGADTGSYFVVVTNATGSVTSAPALLTVVDPVITRQPLSLDSVVGATAVFDVGATGTALEYQWRMNGVPISGASRATLSLTNVGDGDVGSYSVLVSNLYGSVLSREAGLVVYHLPVTQNDRYDTAAGTTLAVAAPGVLGNDTVAGLNNLTARLVSLPAHGFVSLDADGGFVYSAAVGYVGEDRFDYQAVNGPAGSGVATVTIAALAAGIHFADDFSRPTNPGPLSPWVVQSGNWAVTGEVLTGGTHTPSTYGQAYVTNAWTDYSVEGRIRFSQENAWGGGIGGRLDPVTGAHYAVWVHPEGSAGGANTLRLIKFQTWTSFGYNGTDGIPMQEVSLAAPGTNWYRVKLAFLGSQLGVFFDGKQVMSVDDVEAQPYANGGVCVGMWMSEAVYVMLVDDVVVRPLIVNDSYVGKADQTLTVADPGVLVNDTGVYAANLVATLVNGPTNGTLTLSTNGGFVYAPAAYYSGVDSFSYAASQGEASLGVATVTITVAPHDVPVIREAPSSQTHDAGTTAVFTASALGTSPLSYQWFWNGTNALVDRGKVGGARSATLTLSNVLGGDAGHFTLVVTNALGSVTSSPPAVLTVRDPIIASQPVGQTNLVGSTAEFSVGAYGTSPSYQWFRDELPISGATNPSLTLAAVSAADAGGYRVVVSNKYGSVASRTAHLTVIDPVIVEAPVNRTNDAGTTAIFSVAVLGTMPFSYQWFWNGTNALVDRGKVSGARSASLTISHVLGGDAASYTVVVSNALGSVAGSPPAVLTVMDPVITAQPVDQTQTAGSTAEFSAGAYGTSPSYQWFKDEVPINGATNAALTLAAVSAADTGGYRVVVGNKYGSVASRTAHLTVIDPVIVEAPMNRTNDAGTTAIFSVAVLGTLPLSYQWFWNGTNALVDRGKVSGARSASLTISNLLGGDAASYTVVVSNILGSVAGSPPALLTVVDPVITAQPVDRTNAAGSTAEFSVGAYGTSPGYQWFKNEAPISGATDATLTLAAVSAADAGGYHVVVSNSYGSVTSRAARLALAPEPTIESVRFTNGIAVITWSSVPGQAYRLQYKNTLGGTNWYDVLPDIVAVGPTTTVTNLLGGATQRFYQVILAPTVVPPFMITAFRVTNGVAVINWNSIAGQTYQVKYKNCLTDAGWLDALPAVRATDSTTMLTNAIGSASQRIYRVTLVPGGVQPSIRSISMTNGIVTVVWTSVLNQAYRLQYKDSLSDTTWHDVAPDVTATGPATTMTHPIGSSLRRFYRVTVVP